MAEPEEKINRLTLADPRSPAEKVAAMIGRAVSPDKTQRRSFEDSPTTMAVNTKATQKRLDDEKLKASKP